jgi:hypothetical protein
MAASSAAGAAESLSAVWFRAGNYLTGGEMAGIGHEQEQFRRQMQEMIRDEL